MSGPFFSLLFPSFPFFSHVLLLLLYHTSYTLLIPFYPIPLPSEAPADIRVGLSRKVLACSFLFPRVRLLHISLYFTCCSFFLSRPSTCRTPTLLQQPLHTHLFHFNMFYEFSIQYDDQPVCILGQTPLSDILYFNVNHAYPNWIPPHYPHMINETTGNANVRDIIANSKPLSRSLLLYILNESTNPSPPPSNNNDNLTFQYHRYIHLARTYMDRYLPSDTTISPTDSLTSLTMKILSPLVPQGKWTSGANPPQPNEFFYRHFPKQSPDFDNDYHTRNPGVFWGWFYLARWLPDLIQTVLFPLDNIVYNSKLDNEMMNTNKKTTTNGDDSLDEKIEKFTPKARKLTGRQTPTLLECQLCTNFNGFMIWNRQNEWFCVYKDKYDELIDTSSDNISSFNELKEHIKTDLNGKRYFTSFNDFSHWKKDYAAKIIELETKAYNSKNMSEMSIVEDEIAEWKTLRQRKDKITAENIVSVKG